MSAKRIVVIGAVTLDTIHLTSKTARTGDVVVVDRKHSEYGGRGANTAISAYRAAHLKPKSGARPVLDGQAVDVQLIAAVANSEYQEKFRKRLEANGVKPKLEIMEPDEGGQPLEQDYTTAIMDGETCQVTQFVGWTTCDRWKVEHFASGHNIYGETKPDLVIITQELERRAVEQIIQTLHEDGVDILLFATPGEPLLQDSYPKITHLVCNDRDAAKMLGYKPEELNHQTWREMCELFIKRGVNNVVIKLGPRGAFFKTADEEGFSSGYTKISDLVDQTGATNAFVGPYAVQYVKNKAAWDIRSAVERGNRAASLFGIELGYESSIPFSDEIRDSDLEPLYEDVSDLPQAPTRKKLNWKNRRDQREPVMRPRGPTV